MQKEVFYCVIIFDLIVFLECCAVMLLCFPL